MKILITGAKGMVARAAVDHCGSIGDEVIALSRAELDIADPEAVEAALQYHRPHAVLNCAAFTDVDGAESNPQASRAANTDGVGNLAASAKNVGSRFVTISTDYVFDGAKAGFYTQRDTPNPGSVYAVTKYEGERLATEHNAASMIVRSGWIFGHGGTNFLSVMHRLLSQGKKLTAIEDSYGTPTFADDLARRLREIAEVDLPCTYHVTNSGQGTSYFEFARAVCDIGEFDPSLVQPVRNQSLSRPAPRPSTSKLACLFSERLGFEPLPHWREALQAFIAKDPA